MDAGPISLVNYAVSAVPGAVAGLGVALGSRIGVRGGLIVTATGALGGMAGYAVLARLPNPSLPGGIHGPLPLLLIVLTTGFGGWLAAYAASRLLRRRA
jgi:hypothetical protein